MPLGFVVSGGEASDYTGAEPLMALPIPTPKATGHPDYRRYRDRNRAGRMFNKLKQSCRTATRYDKTPLSFESFINLAGARLCIKSYVSIASYYRDSVPE